MTLFQGGNGQGKSNLLEAAYLLAIAKSPRASSDREVVRWQAAQQDGYTRIAATVVRGDESLRIQVDLQSLPAIQGGGGQGRPDRHQGARIRDQGQGGASVQKRIRVNGVPRLASELVGELNAVLFSAQDIQLVYGPPPLRRRYLDILISQLDHLYLRALQRYQRVIYQRNHLLRMIRNGRAQEDEIQFWDDEMLTEGKQIIARRHQTVQLLSKTADLIHREVTGNGEDLQIIYRPSIGAEAGDSEEELVLDFQRTLESLRRREIAQGVSLSGPHRDDLQLLIGGMDAGLYASRGQARTVALALKLAEARYLAQWRGHEPVLLLDDVLSELDASRRAHVLETVSRYQQCLITTTDPELLEERFLAGMARFAVQGGQVYAVGGPESAKVSDDPRVYEE